MSPPADESSVLIDGPWNHRFVSANGTRFHVVEAGTGPLVLFLHGFPEFWWAWQHQLRNLADAGFRAVAIDLRGYGASDKPPRGYDGYTMAADVAGLIRALGERSAVLVGGGYGGAMAWTTAAFHPKLVRRLVITSAAHPLRLRAALFSDPRGQLAAAGPMLKFQLPRYEHVLTRDDAWLVGHYLRQWGGRPWVTGPDFADYERRCRTAMLIPQASFCALEARHRDAAAHRAGVGPVRDGAVRMAAARRGRPLPARRGARPGQRRGAPLGQGDLADGQARRGIRGCR